VDRAVAKTGYADVWELRSRGTLPLETSNYVPIILAMTIMAKNPQNYGIEDIVPEEPLVYDTVEVNVLTSLALVSDIIGRPVSELKELNPALLRDFAPAGYKLHIPRGSSQSLMAGLEMIPAERRASWRAHRTEAGDSLAALATRYRTTVAQLQSVNQITEGEPNAGSLLVVPAVAQPILVARTTRPVVRPGARTQTIARTPIRRPAATQASTAKAAPKQPVRKAAPTVARSTARRPQG
jgi:membrane-bound lytic murein transglycosylase D